LLKAYGLEASSICGIYTPDRDLSNADPSVRANAVRYVKDCVAFASELGALVVIVVPSSVGKTTPSAPLDEEWRLACESIRDAGQFAAGLGVRLAIEVLNRYETYLVNRIDQAIKLRDEVGLDSVGVMVDAFHMNIEERSIPEAIKNAADHLIHVHIADSNREAVGFGHTDLRSLLRTLLEVRYEGYIVMEFVPPRPNPYLAASLTTENETFRLHTGQSINHMKKLYQELEGAVNR
jgi:sugar phosphate isomerase/epimerase